MEFVLSINDHGKTLNTKVGDTVIIYLDENPTTGFLWSIDNGIEDVALLEDSEFRMAEGTGVGGGGQRKLVFKAKTPGEVELKLKHWREWEGEGSIISRFAVILRVEE